MEKTISTHNGSKARRGHNRRDEKAMQGQTHFDPERSDQNETFCDEDPREAYKRIFGEALEKYNTRQTRPERKINDYYSHICQDKKKHPVYEMIVQVGDRTDTGVDAPIERECLKEFYDTWKNRNPNLECIGAYLHADETGGTVHLHLDYIPVAHGYKNGLETQSALVKALGEEGFAMKKIYDPKLGKEKSVTAQIQWEHRENQALEEICREHGIEITHPEAEKREHQEKDQYISEQKAREAEIKAEKTEKVLFNLEERKTALTDEIQGLRGERNQISEEIEELSETEETAEEKTLEAEEKAREALRKQTEAEEAAAKALQSASEAAERAQQAIVRAETAEAEYKRVSASLGGLKESESVLSDSIAEKKQELGAVSDYVQHEEKKLANRQGVRVEDLIRGAQARANEINKARENEKRLSLLEKFIQWEPVKPLWNQFVKMIDKNHSRQRGPER